MKNIFYLSTEEDTQQIGAKVAQALHGGAVIFLQGQLGAGKTTFVRGFLRGLGYTGKVKSPSYALVEPYELADRSIYHFDFYRLADANELEHIGLEEYFFAAAICLIEWPEKAFPLLPEPDLICEFEMEASGRSLQLIGVTQNGVKILERLGMVCSI